MVNKFFEPSPFGCRIPRLPGIPVSVPVFQSRMRASHPITAAAERHTGQDDFSAGFRMGTSVVGHQCGTKALASTERFATDRSMCRNRSVDAKTPRGGIPSAAFCLIHAKNRLAARKLTLDPVSAVNFGRRRRRSENLPKTRREQRPEQHREHRRLRLTIVNAAPYVGLMTKAANEG